MNITDDAPAIYQTKPMITEIVIPNHASPSQNQLNRMSHRAKTSLRKRYEKIIWAGQYPNHPGKVRIEVYRHSPGTLDDDNFRAGCKHLIDAIKNQKVIKDDTNAIMAERFYQQVKIVRTGPKMMVIKITDLV